MSNKYVGTWKLESSENFDEYMKAVGKQTYFTWLPVNSSHDETPHRGYTVVYFLYFALSVATFM